MMNETQTTTKRGKENGYKNYKLHAKRDRKRKEAEARQAKWECLTFSEQLKSLASRRGESKKQVARIQKLANAVVPASAVEEPVKVKKTKKTKTA